MDNSVFFKNDVENKIKQTAIEIEELLESENIDKEKYTKLMYKQLIQGLYLQNVNM